MAYNPNFNEWEIGKSLGKLNIKAAPPPKASGTNNRELNARLKMDAVAMVSKSEGNDTKVDKE